MKFVPLSLTLAAFVAVAPAFSRAESYWNLPAKLSEDTTTVSFELDTTWHTVHGEVHRIAGGANLKDAHDYRSIDLHLLIPVESLDTGNSSRDTKMRDHMDAEKFPTIQFKLTDAKEICDPSRLVDQTPCEFVARGALTIRDVTQEISLPSSLIRLSNGAYEISGGTEIDWSHFGVRDPSILIAKVQPQMKVRFSIRLEREQ